MQRRGTPKCQGSPGNDSWQRSLSTPTCKQDASLGHADRGRGRKRVGGGCVVWEKAKEEGSLECNAKMLQKQKPLVLTSTRTHTLTYTLLRREEGTGSGSLCLRTPEKKERKKTSAPEQGRGKTESESVVDLGQRTIHWIEMCRKGKKKWKDRKKEKNKHEERSRRRAEQITGEMFHYQSE